jgi:hypothetical protein
MENRTEDAEGRKKWIRWLARIWSAPIILFSLIFFAGSSWNWVTGGPADPYAVENVPFIDSLLPILIFFSAIGLAFAWRWEEIGGMAALGFQIIAVCVLLFQRPIWNDFPRFIIPYLMSVAIIIPGLLFLLSRRRPGGINASSAED